MAAPCINDTCSVTSSIDPVTRRLALDVILNPSGGLECDSGLGVHVYGDPAPAAIIDEAFQQLGITPAGEVWSIPKRARVHNFGSSDPVPIPHNGTESNNPIDSGDQVVNPYNSPALVLMVARLRVGYTVEQVGVPQCLTTGAGIEWVPYSGQLTARFKVDNDPKTAVLYDIGGVHPRNATPHHKRRWEYSVWAGIIGAGATMVLTADAAFQGDGSDTRFNIDTATAPGSAPIFAERGLMCNGQAIIMPFGGGA